MLLGIDVGGTSTDGVLIQQGAVERSIKRPRNSSGLTENILDVLDGLLEGLNPEEVRRLVISTTLVTNLLVTQGGVRTALLLVPGRGLPFDYYKIAPDTYFLQGNVDFRGNVTEHISETEINTVIDDVREKGIRHIAVAAKFSHRNRCLEQEIAGMIGNRYPEAAVLLGSEIADRLNFPRRAATAYYSAITAPRWSEFASRVEAAVKQRGLTAPVEILKADGGTMPLEVSRQRPLETAYSGPAASTMGAVALSPRKENAVMIDIGGTTADIALLIEGEPLHASKGACIGGRFTHINALALRSLALGGDSCLKAGPGPGKIEIAAERLGQAACFGGPAAAVTDAFNMAGNLNIGEAAQSESKIAELAASVNMAPLELSNAVVDLVVTRLQALIEEMFREWENEPAYKVWEIVHRRSFKLDRLIGIGAAAGQIVPLLSERIGVPATVHRLAPVGNALGAAVARPTLALHLYADTEQKRFVIDQEGIEGVIPDPSRFQLERAEKLALEHLAGLAAAKGAGGYAKEARVDLAEQFNMIRGWSSVGRIFQVAVQIAPGLIDEFQGVSE